ncbi:unnamed protein product [Cylindrotheca closterium]|uniref:Sulfhydryl oxidase n=1 Tax=Cylindrotheca closterium TaxID=2856 RepID=A0AAD2GBU2_9STRA|nr:unnamed protein product [Cylindrotheca closterium]
MTVVLQHSCNVCSLFMLTMIMVTLTMTSVVQAAAATADNSQYMYLKMEPTARYPVQEVRLDDVTQTHETTLKDGKAHKEPDFLSPNYAKPKVVEYYAHWCPHCIHFKPQYIQFARKMKSIAPQVNVFAVSCVPWDVICRDQGVTGYPTVLLYEANSVNGTVIQRNNLHPLTVLRKLGMTVSTSNNVNEDKVPKLEQPQHFASVQVQQEQQQQQQQQEQEQQQHDHHKVAAHHFMHKSQQEAYNDAHLSLDFALRNGVFVTNNKLPTLVKTALQEFLVVVQKTFPPTAPLQPLVEHLINDFNDIFSNNEEELETVLNQFATVSKPPSSTWSPACMQHGTGYTCGLWQLFHIITIGAIEWNQMSSQKSQQLTTMHVADSIRGFVQHFFQCEECRMHFLHEYDSCSYDRCNRLTDTKMELIIGADSADLLLSKWQELPLWLYETHNGVNARLRKERLTAEQPEQVEDTTPQEVLWPPQEWCSSCWLGEGRWEDHKIYEFLRAQYWPGVTFDDTLNNNNGGGNQQYHHDQDGGNNGLEAVHASATTKDEYEPHHEEQRRQQWQQERQNKYDDDEEEPLPLWKRLVAASAIVMVLVMASIAWYRKIQFDRRGYLKKNESFEP